MIIQSYEEYNNNVRKVFGGRRRAAGSELLPGSGAPANFRLDGQSTGAGARTHLNNRYYL